MKLPSTSKCNSRPTPVMPRFQQFEQPADYLDMETCTCGARIPHDMTWCPVCLRSAVDKDALLAELHDTFRKTTWDAPEALVAPPPPKRFSRWEEGPLSFGPRIKIALSILVGLLQLGVLMTFQPWYLFMHSPGDHPGLAFVFFVTVISVGFSVAALRFLWRMTRVE